MEMFYNTIGSAYAYDIVFDLSSDLYLSIEIVNHRNVRVPIFTLC